MVADASFPLGGTWNDENTIVFAPELGKPILRVSAGGGTTTPVTSLGGARFGVHGSPQFLPDGQHFLYVVATSPNEGDVHVGSIDSTETTRLVPTQSPAVYSPSGHLLYSARRRPRGATLRPVAAGAFR